MNRRGIVSLVSSHALLVLVSSAALLPLFWALKSSFTPTGEVLSTPIFSAPSQWTMANYSEGWHSAPFTRYFFNSLLIAVVVTSTTVVTATLAGYGFAKFRFRGQNILFSLVIAALMMPFQAIMIPLFVEVRTFGWLDSYAGLIVPGAVSAFSVFMMRQFMRSVPDELAEAARLDGCSEWGTFIRVVIPLARGPMIALAALTFLASWNNFLWPLIVIQSQNMTTVPLGLAQFRGSNSTDYGQVMAVAMLAAVPVVIIFVILRRRIVASFATSGLK